VENGKTVEGGNKENQVEVFTDDDFTNNLNSIAEIPKPARPSMANLKHRQSEADLAFRLAEYQAKKQKRETLGGRGIVPRKHILQSIDTNSHAPPPQIKTPRASCAKLEPTEFEAKPAVAAATNAPDLTKRVKVDLKPGESNEIRLAKERLVAQQHNLHEQESKMALKAKELRSRECKVESDHASLERREKAFIELVKTEKEQLEQDKLAHKAKLDRCDKLDAEMKSREEALEKNTLLKRDEIEALSKEREAQIELEMKEKTAACEATIQQKQDEFEAFLRKSNAELEQKVADFESTKAQFEAQMAAFAVRVQQHEADLDAVKQEKAEVSQFRAETETFKEELEQLQIALKKQQQDLEATKENIQSRNEECESREAALRQNEKDHETRVEQARSSIEESDKLAKKIAREEATLKQQQKVLQIDKEQFMASSLEWQSEKETLIFENERLKSESILERGRLETSKKNMAADRAAFLAEKVQLSHDLQRYSEAEAAYTVKARELALTDERVKNELEYLEREKKAATQLEGQLLAQEIANKTKAEALESAERIFEQQQEEWKEKQAWMEAELESVCSMKAQIIERDAALKAQEVHFEEEKARLKRIQLIIEAGEDAHSEKEIALRKKEEELFAMREFIEKQDLELRQREFDVVARQAEFEEQSANMRKLQAVFNT